MRCIGGREGNGVLRRAAVGYRRQSCFVRPGEAARHIEGSAGQGGRLQRLPVGNVRGRGRGADGGRLPHRDGNGNVINRIIAVRVLRRIGNIKAIAADGAHRGCRVILPGEAIGQVHVVQGISIGSGKPRGHGVIGVALGRGGCVGRTDAAGAVGRGNGDVHNLAEIVRREGVGGRLSVRDGGAAPRPLIGEGAKAAGGVGGEAAGIRGNRYAAVKRSGDGYRAAQHSFFRRNGKSRTGGRFLHGPGGCLSGVKVIGRVGNKI